MAERGGSRRIGLYGESGQPFEAMDLRIREYKPDDYERVFALWSQAGPGLRIRPSDRREEVIKKLARDPDLFLVAESSEEIVGVVMGAWDGRRGWLHHLAVSPACRRRGVAAALVGTVEKRLRRKGCLKVNLLVFRDNEGARCFYERLGYQEMTPVVAMGKEL